MSLLYVAPRCTDTSLLYSVRTFSTCVVSRMTDGDLFLSPLPKVPPIHPRSGCRHCMIKEPLYRFIILDYLNPPSVSPTSNRKKIYQKTYIFCNFYLVSFFDLDRGSSCLRGRTQCLPWTSESRVQTLTVSPSPYHHLVGKCLVCGVIWSSRCRE